MGSGIYSIGVSALQVAQLGLATTSHNIANANTDGYNRQRILQASNVGVATGAGYVGQGAHVTTIERLYSGLITSQVNTAQSKVSSLESYSTELTSLNNLLSDSDSGLASALQSFFTGVQQVSSDPSSLTTRQTLVSSAQAMTSRFQSLNTLIEEQYDGINTQIQGYVSSVNSYSQQIADLNEQIVVAESANSQPPNDLYDQRDQLVAELNKLIGASTTTNTDGSFNVFFGNGQPLVTGTQVSKLVAMTSSSDPTRVTVGVETSGAPIELPESVITGGSLSGVMEYRSEVLDDTSNRLGQIAVSLAYTFNAQHALGQDLQGNIGDDVAAFFTISDPTVISSDTAAPTISVDIAVESSSDGTFYTNLTASDYQLDYDGTNLTLTRLSDNTKVGVAATLSELNDQIKASEGFTLTGSDVFDSADTGVSYLIKPTSNAAASIAVNATIAADVRQIAAAAPIRTSAASTNTGKASVSAGSVASGYSAPASGSPVTLTYSDGNISGFSGFPVVVTVDGVTNSYGSTDTIPYSNGATYTSDGISFTISGVPANNDSFSIERNTNGVSDNRNSLLLAKLQSGKTMAGNTASYSTVYAQLVSEAGNKGSEAQTILAAQTTLLAEAQDSRDSLSGVNLDEEAANLLKYQQAYQAAAKMLQIASEMFDAVLNIR